MKFGVFGIVVFDWASEANHCYNTHTQQQMQLFCIFQHSGIHFHFNNCEEKYWHQEIPSFICYNCESKIIIFPLISVMKIYSN